MKCQSKRFHYEFFKGIIPLEEPFFSFESIPKLLHKGVLFLSAKDKTGDAVDAKEMPI